MLRSLNKKYIAQLFVEVPRFARLIARSMVILYFVVLVLLAMLSDGMPLLTAGRVAAVGLMLILSCWPLLFSMPGVGFLHPLYFLSAYGFVKGTLLDLPGYAFGLETHPALPTLRPFEIGKLQIEAILLDALAWLMIYAGFRIAKGFSWRSLQFHEKPQLEFWGAVLAYILGMLSFVLLVQVSGGFEQHLKNIARGMDAKVFVGNPQFASTYAFLVTLTMIAPALLLLKKRDAARRPLFWLLALSSSVLLLLVNGRRSAILRPTLLFLTCWVHRNGRLPIFSMVVIAIVLLLSIGVVGEYRRSNWSSPSNRVNFDAVTDLNLEQAFQLSLGEIQTRREGGPIYPIIYRVPSEIPFLYGMNYFDYIKRFTPRILWPTKPRGIGVDCARTFYGVTYAIPPGPLGEAYWSGGPLGVAIVFFLWGMLLKSLFKFFLRFHQSSIACLLYLMTLAMLTPDETGFRSWSFLFVPTVSLLFATGMLTVRTGIKVG